MNIKIWLRRLVSIPFIKIAKYIKKDKNIWVFGSWFGEKYADNSKYLFEYINKNQSQIKAIWLTKNKKIIKRLKKKGYKVYYSFSIPGLYFSIKAKVSIFTQSSGEDCSYILNNDKSKLIQLWHGIPLKKIGKDDKVYYKPNKKNIKLKIRNFLENKLFSFLHEEYDLMIASGEFDRKVFIRAFNVKKVQVTGYPRNDVFFKNKKKKTNKFNIIYMPTFRGSKGSKVDLLYKYGFKENKWDNFLSTYNTKLFIKLHPVNFPSKELLEKINKYKNIIFFENEDIYEVINDFDMLITDYSSVYFDYLLSDKPIIFAPFDYKEYLSKDRELYFDYDEVTPGPKCKDWGEVMEWIKKFKENPNLYSEQRKEIRNKFHKYQDGKNCERVYREIKRLIYEQ